MDYLSCNSIYIISDKGSIHDCSLVYFVLFLLYHFLLKTFLKQGLTMKKIIFSILICSLLSCQENSHMVISDLPELTK